MHFCGFHRREMIKLAIVLLLATTQVLGSTEDVVNPLVVGGTPAEPGSYPFAVSLRQASNEAFFCGGALVSDRYVLTAAHCAVLPVPVVVGVGSVNLKEQTLYPVEKAVVHPGYKPPRTQNDLALLKLKTPVKLSPQVQVLDFQFTGNPENKNVTAMGWGKTSKDGPASTTLLTLKRQTLTNRQCWKRFPLMRLTKGQLCLGTDVNFGMCFGDSGSPLVYNENGKNYAVGVVSFGVPCAVGLPDVFTRVSHYKDWLMKNMV